MTRDTVMADSLRSLLLGTAALQVTLLVALFLTWTRPGMGDGPSRDRLLRGFSWALAWQCLHVLEEFLTGFYVRFPALLGLVPWSEEFFLTFNLVWLAIWIVSATALRDGRRWALWPIWFFAMGMLINGVAHPLLAFVAGGYFPGLWTAPLAGFLGGVVFAQLLALTRSPGLS